MNPLRQRWETFQRDLRRRQVAAWVSVTAYPATVIAAAICLAAMVFAGGAGNGTVGQVASDLAPVVALGWIGIVLTLPGRRKRYDRTRWYEIASNLVEAFLRRDAKSGNVYFDRTRTILAALARAGIASHGAIVDGVIAEMSRGTAFVHSLRTAGCPAEICVAVAEATSNRDLCDRLGELLTAYRVERFDSLERWRRFLQPVSVAAAGAVVLWIVVHIVIPAFTERFYRWSGAL